MLNSEEVLLLRRIKGDRVYNDWFFKDAESLKWFYALKEEGYFSPRQIKYDEQNNALFWNVLDYLEKVSLQVAQEPQFGTELIDTIEEVVRFSTENKENRVNNYYIWWYCVKILNNLPPSVFTAHLSISTFNSWLSSWPQCSARSSFTLCGMGEILLTTFR